LRTRIPSFGIMFEVILKLFSIVGEVAGAYVNG
jgi:hypothetical protein